jgi:hypothetical protein
MYYDSSKFNTSNVLLDIAGIPLGFLGLGGETLQISQKGVKVLQTLGLVDSGFSLLNAHNQNDTVGQWLAIGSAFPMVGGFFSTMSLSRDLATPWSERDYIPPIPR